MMPSFVPSSSSSSSSCSVKLSTLVKKVNLVVECKENQSIILDFYNYMQEKGSSENHQVNNLKVVMDFAKFLGPVSFYDITNKPDIEKVIGTFILRRSYVKWEPEEAISRIQSISKDKMDLLDLALAYYRLGYYDNPLRIEAFFSCLTVIIRNILGIPEKDDVKTSSLKYGIKKILMERDSNFHNDKFEKAWKDCYGDERCPIVHGRGSRLIDISKIPEHEELVKIVHFWTREVIYYFIVLNQSV